MAKSTWRLPVTLALTLAALAAVLVFAASAFAVPGDSAENAVELFSGSSLTTAVVPSGNTGVFYLRMLLSEGNTVRMQFTSGPGLLRLNPIKFPLDGTDAYAYSVNTPVAPGSDQWNSVLYFKAMKTGMYTVYCPSSTAGTFTVLPKITLTTKRIAGLNRYETSVAISKKAFAGTASTVVIAAGTKYPDAMAAAPLAKAYGGPVLLTSLTSLPTTVTAELKRLAPTKVFIAGSTASVSQAVQNAIAALPSHPSITRFAGVNRFDTAARMADTLKAKLGSVSQVVVVGGYDYHDGLLVAPLAAAKGWPILLSPATSASSYTSSCLGRLKASKTLVVADTAEINATVYNGLTGTKTRIGNTDHYVQSGALVDYAKTQGVAVKHVSLAKGTDFPDALSADPYLARDGALLMMTTPTSLPSAVNGKFSGNKTTITALDIFGSTASISEGVVNQAETALHY